MVILITALVTLVVGLVVGWLVRGAWDEFEAVDHAVLLQVASEVVSKAEADYSGPKGVVVFRVPYDPLMELYRQVHG